MESVIVAGLTAVVATLGLYGWKFFTKKKASDKELLIRIIFSAVLCAINAFFVIFFLISLFNYEDESDIITMLFVLPGFSAIVAFFGRRLYKDYKEREARKNSESNKGKNNRSGKSDRE